VGESSDSKADKTTERLCAYWKGKLLLCFYHAALILYCMHAIILIMLIIIDKEKGIVYTARRLCKEIGLLTGME
jgi:lipopolysaccharide/colanic/teichoic acid biosynthesis glycosyltransferase